jgi:hypothetical protein
MTDFPIADVTVHIDTEEDIDQLPSERLPLRDEVLRRLERYFADIPQARRIERTTLHYGAGHIAVELVLPLAAAPDDRSARSLTACFNAAVREDPQIGPISVLFH